MQRSGKHYSPRCILVTDLDGTLYGDALDVGDDKLRGFNQVWRQNFEHDSLLVYCTGRSLAKFNELKAAAPLLEPDILICSVGTELYRSNGQLDSRYAAQLDSSGWNHAQLWSAASAAGSGLVMQASSEQRPHKISLELEADADADVALARLNESLSATGVPYSVIYSSSKDVDVLPLGASKGAALRSLIGEWSAAGLDDGDVRRIAERVMVAGDSGNDTEMMAVDGVRVCCVGNAKPELLRWLDDHCCARMYQAKGHCADGILEALRHFGFMLEDA